MEGTSVFVAIINGLFGWLPKLFGRRNENAIPIPKKTVRLVLAPRPNAAWWHMGTGPNGEAMQVVADFVVTNISRLNILVPAIRLKRPKMVGQATVKQQDSNLHGFFPIPPAGTSDLRISLWITPPVRLAGQRFEADVCVIDQFGNEHWVKKIKFTYS